jgi:spore coat protein U-like protein
MVVPVRAVNEPGPANNLRLYVMKNSKAVVVLLLAATHASFATTGMSSATFNVTAQVNATCVINLASALTFPAYAPNQGAQASTSTISVNCTNTTPFNIGLNAGTGTGATVTNRLMTSGTNTLNYSLYQDSGHSLVWGNTVGTNTVSGTGGGLGGGSAITKTVYGQIPSQPGTPPGNYADTITVTVTY